MKPEFACHYSPVLRAAFEREFNEGQIKPFRLEETEPSAFRLFVKYLYSERLEIQAEEDSNEENVEDGHDDGDAAAAAAGAADEDNDDDEEGYRARGLELAHLWVLCQSLLIPRLQNAVIWAWHRLWSGTQFLLSNAASIWPEISAINYLSCAQCTKSD